MKETPSKQLIEEVALLMSLSSSYVEKDWYIVQILAIISEIQHEEFSLIFAGGTALSKAHKLIYRMSEDIDFKLNIYSELLKSEEEVSHIACLDPVENAADKLSALSWRNSR